MPRGFVRVDGGASVQDVRPHFGQVHFGLYDSEMRKTSVRIFMSWYPKPTLECPCDAFVFLAQCQDVLDMLATCAVRNISVDNFCEMLKSCGFLDMTEAQ